MACLHGRPEGEGAMGEVGVAGINRGHKHKVPQDTARGSRKWTKLEAGPEEQLRPVHIGRCSN